MKIRVTKKAVRAAYEKIIAVGNEQVYYLLQGRQPVAYVADKYGWAADVYDVDGVAIVSGYRPFGDIHPAHDIIARFNRSARYASPAERKELRENFTKIVAFGATLEELGYIK